MESLLSKVKQIEEETQGQLQKIEQRGDKKLADLLASENDLKNEVRDRTRKRAGKIIAEITGAVKEEINKIKQDEDKAVEMIRAGAAKNRADAIARVEQLFREEYL